MIFNECDHTKLATLSNGFCDNWDSLGCQDVRHYPGYRPTVREAPNGDTRVCPGCAGVEPPLRPCGGCDGTGRVPNLDTEKRFLHVALKYDPPAWAVEYLARAHFEACRVAEALGVPAAYYPRVADGTLRVLEYPAGAGSAEHTDFDLFTILCWRSTPEDLELTRHAGKWSAHRDGPLDRFLNAQALSPGLHIGELGELVGLGPATPHRVPARPYTQRSIVYFAMPDHGARLPDVHVPDGPTVDWYKRGPTVGQWLAERMARSRVYT